MQRPAKDLATHGLASHACMHACNPVSLVNIGCNAAAWRQWRGGQERDELHPTSSVLRTSSVILISIAMDGSRRRSDAENHRFDMGLILSTDGDGKVWHGSARGPTPISKP